MSDDRAASTPAGAAGDSAEAQEAAFNANNHTYSMAIALGAMSQEEVGEAIRRDYPLYWARLHGAEPARAAPEAPAEPAAAKTPG
jgi:hypothetical protein